MSEVRERVARISSKGQVTIPVEFRRALGVTEGDSLLFRSRDGVLTLTAVKKPTLDELLASFDPARHRHGLGERPWDDAPGGRETI